MRVRILSVLRLAVTRLRSRPALSLLSLVGVVLGIALATCVPIFSQGVSFLVLSEELTRQAEFAGHPPFTLRLYYTSSSAGALSYSQAMDMERMLKELGPEEIQLPLSRIVTTVDGRRVTLLSPVPGSPGTTAAQMPVEANFTVMGGIGEHLEIIEGLPYGDTSTVPAGVIAVWIHEKLANTTGFNAGDSIRLQDRASYVRQTAGQVLPAYVAGIWRPVDRTDPFWYDDPAISLAKSLLVTRETYLGQVEPGEDNGSSFVTWYMVFDHTALSVNQADGVARGLARMSNIMPTYLPGMRLDYSPLEPLTHYLQRKATLSVLLTGFSLPGMGLLLYFLWLISSVTAQFQGSETAILASRGAGRSFILGLSACEAAILMFLGTPLGMATGYGLARLMGNSLSFLAFTKRAALPAHWSSFDWRLLVGALFMLLAARLVPTFAASRESVATHGVRRSRPTLRARAVVLLLDVVLIAVTAYAYNQLKLRGTLGILGWEPSGNPFQDPLLLLAPSLFVGTVSLLAAQLFPWLGRLVDRVNDRNRIFPAYMGILNLARQGGQYAGALFLVVACLSLGAFYSSMAASLDAWLVNSIYFQVGSDYTFTHGIPIEMLSGGGQSMPSASGGSWLLPASDYLTIPGVQEATRVGSYTAVPTLPGTRAGELLAIDRLDFPKVAFWRDEFADVPLGELMNRLGMYDDGVIISNAFMEANALQEGQRLELGVRVGSDTVKLPFRIVGTYESFPSAAQKGAEVFVVNLERFFEKTGGVQRHAVWMRIDDDADPGLIIERLEGMGIVTPTATDTRIMIAQDEDSVERIGLFGVLSIGFLAGSALSCIGLLVYTYAALMARVQRLSLLRAMGVRTEEVLGMVGVEYAGVNLYGVLAGVAIGVICSRLFVPFFQFSPDPKLALPPFVAQIAWDKILWIALLFAGALALAQMVILFRVTRRDVFQQLRMVQRE